MFERALDVNPADVLLWLNYCETVRLRSCSPLLVFSCADEVSLSTGCSRPSFP